MLLDILEQSDNNVQKASEKLIDLGYEKRNLTGPKSLARRKEEEQVIYRNFLYLDLIRFVVVITFKRYFYRRRMYKLPRLLRHV